MPDSLPLTPSTDPEPLCISGMLAIHAARVAVHMPGWPSLHRFVQGKAPQSVSLAEAEADLLRGWGVSGYVYPVPRSLIGGLRVPGRMAREALRGSEPAILAVVLEAALEKSASAQFVAGLADAPAFLRDISAAIEVARPEVAP